MSAHFLDINSRPDLPHGRLALVFTDIEGSTRMLRDLGPEYAAHLAAHRRILRASFAAHAGVEVDTQGDSFFAVFRHVKEAIEAVAQAQCALQEFNRAADHPLRVRFGLHCGEPTRTEEGYVGLDLHRCARLMSAGHGGQILLSGEAVKSAGQLGARYQLRALGEHRLKDLAHPEQIFQLCASGLPTEFAPLRTIDNRPHNLPSMGSPIVGRAREIAKLREKFEAGARLITLLGPGGTGKTRLSLAIAHAARDLWPDGVFFVPLAPLVAPENAPTEALEEAIAEATARALGLRDDGSQTLAERLLHHLKERQLLLVLDNFEHLVGGATVVARWREQCPKLALLASSRIPLHLRGELQFPVEPLRHPQRQTQAQPALPVEKLARFGAVALFVERARAVQPNFALDQHNAPIVAEICARLDGLPLAIELAAARIKVLSPAALLKRLDSSLNFLTGRVRDALGHHQTLRAAIEWSYDLLSDDEKRLFRRLAVFRGGFTLQGAERVCADPLLHQQASTALEVFEGVSSLFDQSLLLRFDDCADEPRFYMLETIRQFALEKLEECGESEQMRARHLEWITRETDERRAEMRGDFARALRRFGAEADNWRAAWGWSIAARPDDALRMAADSALLWNSAGNTSENYQRLERSLLAAPDGDAQCLCRALKHLVQTDRNCARWNSYHERLEQVEALSHAAALPEYQAIALDQRMWDAVGAKEPVKALEMSNTILRLRRECLEQARAQRLDEREITRREDELLDAMILHVEILVGVNENEAAWKLMKQCLAAKRVSGDEAGLNLALCKYAQLLALNGRHHKARPFAEELVQRIQESGDRSLSVAYYLHDAAEIVLEQGDLVRALELLCSSYVLCKENESAMGYLLILRSLEVLHAQTENWSLFARLKGAMSVTGDWRASTSNNASDLPTDNNESTAIMALGEDEFNAQCMIGRQMGTHQIIEMALRKDWITQVATY